MQGPKKIDRDSNDGGLSKEMSSFQFQESNMSDDGASSIVNSPYFATDMAELTSRSRKDKRISDPVIEEKYVAKKEKVFIPWCQSEPPITNKGKHQQQVKMIILILLPFATLLSVALYMNTDSIFAMIQAEQTKSTVEFSVFVGRLIVVLQKEQDQSVLFLSSIGPETKFFLTQTYMQTDLYLEELPYWPVGLDRSDRRFFDSKNAFRNYLQQHRDELGASNVTIYDEILFYKNSIDVFLIWLYDALKESRYSNLWKTLVSYQKVIFCHHYAGIERALGTTYFVEGGFSDPYMYIKYNEVVYVFKNNFEAAMKYSPLVKPISQYNALVNGENLTEIIERYRDQIQFQNISAPLLNDAAAWFDFMSTYLDVLFNFQTELAEDILQILNERSTRVLTDVASSSLVICIVIIILPLTLRAIYNLTNDIQSYAITLACKTKELNKEKRKTDSLLHQMLPVAVACRLKRKKSQIAEFFQSVTIYFSDIPGFTKLASEMAPMEIVCMLNFLYTMFDSRIEKYDVYKVETIGDSYMVASGLPKPNDNRHVMEIANMALDLMHLAEKISFEELQVPVTKINLRVGIHSGPVVAGVVGSRLPRYCLFGDTVNTASRMETHGQANKIHVSLTTKKLLVKYGSGYMLESRGKVALKGKGEIDGYWLLGRNNFPGRKSNSSLSSLSGIRKIYKNKINSHVEQTMIKNSVARACGDVAIDICSRCDEPIDHTHTTCQEPHQDVLVTNAEPLSYTVSKPYGPSSKIQTIVRYPEAEQQPDVARKDVINEAMNNGADMMKKNEGQLGEKVGVKFVQQNDLPDILGTKENPNPTTTEDPTATHAPQSPELSGQNTDTDSDSDIPPSEDIARQRSDCTQKDACVNQNEPPSYEDLLAEIRQQDDEAYF